MLRRLSHIIQAFQTGSLPDDGELCCKPPHWFSLSLAFSLVTLSVVLWSVLKLTLWNESQEQNRSQRLPNFCLLLFVKQSRRSWWRQSRKETFILKMLCFFFLRCTQFTCIWIVIKLDQVLFAYKFSLSLKITANTLKHKSMAHSSKAKS